MCNARVSSHATYGATLNTAMWAKQLHPSTPNQTTHICIFHGFSSVQHSFPACQIQQLRQSLYTSESEAAGTPLVSPLVAPLLFSSKEREKAVSEGAEGVWMSHLPSRENMFTVTCFQVKLQRQVNIRKWHNVCHFHMTLNAILIQIIILSKNLTK